MKNGLILGFFDGVHIAHQAVINSVDTNHSVLITFKESPTKFFCGHAEYILSRSASINKLKNLGVNEIVELDFAEVVNLDAEQYLQYLIKKYMPVSISTGFNHTFGLNKTGNANFLEAKQEQYHYKYLCIPPQHDGNRIISSTYIKELLKNGEIIHANKLLGSNFTLEAKVIHGEKLATKIGFPTANMKYPNDIVKIPYGVYSIKVRNMPAILNWGIKPTFNNVNESILEIHIPNFHGNLYNQNISFEVLKKIRDEKKFTNIEALKVQIEKDIKICLES